MPKVFKKILLSFLIATFVLAPVFTRAVSAANMPWYSPSFADFYTKASDPAGASEIFGERYTLAQVNWIFWSIPSFLINQTMGPELGVCVFQNAPTSFTDLIFADEIFTITIQCALPAFERIYDILFVYETNQQKSLFAAITNHGNMSAIAHFSDIIQKIAGFKIIPEAHAQTGFGFNALKPILELWKVTRNLSYSLLIVVVIAMAFMIMFRVKLSPQTVITVQSAIPKVVMAIILITFSYAIAGLLVDLMYVVYGIISLAAKPLYSDSTTVVDIFNAVTGNSSKIGYFGSTFIVGLLILIGGIILAVATSFTGIGFIFGILFIVLAVIILYTIVRIIFMLIKAYASVILLTVAGPFYILLGTVMSGMGIGGWIRNLASNLAIFVTTSVLLMLSNRFINLALPILPGSSEVGIGLSDTGWVPLIGGGGSGLAKLVLLGVAIVLFTTAPKAAQLIQAIIKGQPFAFGTAIGEALLPLPVKTGLTYYAAKKEEKAILAAKTANLSKPLPVKWAQVLRGLGIIR